MSSTTPQPKPEQFEALFRVLDVRDHHNDAYGYHLQLRLENTRCCTNAIYVPIDGLAPHLHRDDIIQASFRQGLGSDVIELVDYSQKVPDIDQQIDLLRRTRCLDPKSLGRLHHLVSSIAFTPLRHCVIRLLTAPSISGAYLMSPASQRHHHTHTSGLLTHSVEVAMHVSSQCEDKAMRDLMIVAALLHDIGKICYLDGPRKQSPTERVLGHELLGLLMCEPELRVLEGACPESAAVLRYLLTDAVLYKGARRVSLPEAALLQSADRLSADRSATRQALSRHPHYHRLGRNNTKAGCWHWQPRPRRAPEKMDQANESKKPATKQVTLPPGRKRTDS